MRADQIAEDFPVVRADCEAIEAVRMIADHREERADIVVWATGFRPALAHLRPMHLREADGTIAVEGTRAIKEPALHLLGYGDWTGPGSATLIGVGRTARAAVKELFPRTAPTS